MSNTYKIQLYPETPFFFGNENTFGENNQNYYVKSNLFPQQTSLLGMLRFEMLKQDKNVFANNRITQKQQASKLIGEKSFIANTSNSFGKLLKIHPVFLEKNSKAYFVAAKDECLHDNKSKRITPIYNESFLQNYSAKDGFGDYVCSGDEFENLFYDKGTGVFIAYEQVGITKSARRSDEEKVATDKGFYRKISYQLNKGFCFSFHAEFSDDYEFKSNKYVQLGGEKSTFKVIVEKLKEGKAVEDVYPALRNTSDYWKVILLNDARLTNHDLSQAKFHITDTVDFRCIESVVDENESYLRINSKQHHNKNFKKSSKLNLIKRGSVLFFDKQKTKDEIKQIFSNPCFEQIGYNKITII